MKKITLLFLLCLFSHLSFSQVLFEDDFDGSGPGIAGWTLNDVDGQTPNAAVSEFTAAWIEVDKDASAGGGANYGGPAGDFAVASTSWYDPAGQSDDWLITPQINLTAASTVYWDAKTQDAAYQDGYELRLSTTGTNPADFTEVLFTIANEVSEWESRSVSLGAFTGQNVYIAFRNNSTDQFVLLMDNFEVSVTPSCTIPTDITAVETTDTTFGISWMDANNGGPTFEIEWGATGFTPGTGTIVSNIATTTYNFMGLMPDTIYDFYIRTNCPLGDDSAWVGPITFQTLFDCTTYGLPYSQDFDNPNAFASCFTTEDVDGNTADWITQQDLDLDGDLVNETFATNPNTAAPGGKDDWMFSPAFSLTGGVEYTATTAFNVFGGTATGDFEAFIVDAATSTATSIATLFSNTSIPTQGDFATLETMAYVEANNFTPATSGDYYIAYHSFGADGSGFILMFNSSLDTTLGVDDFDSNNFSHSYNKNTQQLTIESANLPFDGIEVYSLLGQKVIDRRLSQTTEAIDMSQLTKGVYLATVSINGNSKTIKLIKH